MNTRRLYEGSTRREGGGGGGALWHGWQTEKIEGHTPVIGHPCDCVPTTLYMTNRHTENQSWSRDTIIIIIIIIIITIGV